MEQHVRTSLTRCNGLDLIGMCGKRRGQHGGLATLACRSTPLGWSRVQQQHRQRQPLTLTRKCERSRCDLRAGSPESLFVASSAAWKASLLAKPADIEVTSCTSSSTFWHNIAAAIRCVHRQQQFSSCLDLSQMGACIVTACYTRLQVWQELYCQGNFDCTQHPSTTVLTHTEQLASNSA